METCPYCGQGPIPAGAAACPTCGAALVAPTLPLGTRLHGGRYAVGRVLGQGGFGITYQGADTMLRRPVAIKEFFPDGSARGKGSLQPPSSIGTEGFIRLKDRFLDEARTLAQFSHPGIVRVLDIFSENGTAYLVMEFLEGQTFSGLIHRAGQLPAAEVIRIAHLLGNALQVVHSAGLLHRDIKPDNIFLTKDDRAVLIDFGSARGFVQGQRMRHTQLLTPGYAPLEQYAAEARFGPYTDIYALGATLYHALSGMLPPPAAVRAIGTPLNALPSDVPAPLRQAIEKALALRVEERPQSVAEFLGLLGPAPQQSGPDANMAPGPHLGAGANIAPGPNAGPGAHAHPAPAHTQHAPPGAVLVSPDGSGGLPTLAAAVRQAAPGSVLFLAAGVYRITESIVLDRPLTLLGEKMERTIITGDVADVLVHVQPSGTVSLQDMTLRREGQTPGDVLGATAGELLLTCCRLEGAQGKEDRGGNGLALWQQACTLIRDCVFAQNAVAGLRLGHQSRFNLEGCTITGNLAGISITDHAAGLIKGCRVEQNTGEGISGNGSVQITLDGNTIEQNDDGGVILWDQAGGNVRQNRSCKNGADGLFLNTQGRLLVEGNLCEENGDCGIWVAGIAPSSIVRQNHCKSNANHGIQAGAEAQPVLEGNTCTANKGHGITFSVRAAGSAALNTCSDNGMHGILISGNARPTLQGNICQSNRIHGIVYLGQAAGIARQNTCASNERMGIYVDEDAQPKLEENTCATNGECGIAYFGRARGSARQNICNGHEQYGLYVGEQARPILTSNRCWDNKLG